MAKKKVKRAPSAASRKDAGPGDKKKFNLQRALYLFISTLAAFALLEGVIAAEERAGLAFSIITPIYYIICTVLFLVVVFLNRGFSKRELTPDMLDEGTPHEDAVKICEKVNHQKKLSKKVMLMLVPFVLAVLLDIIYLFYGDMLVGIFSIFS